MENYKKINKKIERAICTLSSGSTDLFVKAILSNLNLSFAPDHVVILDAVSCISSALSDCLQSNIDDDLLGSIGTLILIEFAYAKKMGLSLSVAHDDVISVSELTSALIIAAGKLITLHNQYLDGDLDESDHIGFIAEIGLISSIFESKECAGESICIDRSIVLGLGTLGM